MENNKYLSEEKYQRTSKKLRKIALTILIVGISISAILVGRGLYQRSIIPKQIETEKEKLEVKLVELENKVQPILDEVKKLERVAFTGFDEEYYQRKDKIVELNNSIRKEQQQIVDIKSYLENGSCFDDEVTNTVCSLEDKLNRNALFYIPAIPVTMFSLMLSLMLFVTSKRREIAAFGAQQMMPIAKEGIDEMTPTVGNAAKEIAKSIKQGINDTDKN